MSVLDTFYILFKSNTADLKKGNDEAKKSVKGLESELNKVDTVTQNIGKNFTEVGRSLAGMAAGAFSIHSLLSGLSSTFNYTVGLDLASRTLGVNRRELEAWGYAVERTGGDLKSFESSLMGFAKHINTTMPDALRVLPELAESLSKMTETRALQYGEMLGLDASTITFLRQGREEVDRVIESQKQLGLVTDDSAQSAREYNIAWLQARHGLTSAFAGVESDLLPTLTTMTNKLTAFTQYLQHNTGLIKGTLIGLGVVAAAVAIQLLAPYWAIIAALAGFALLYNQIEKTYRYRHENHVNFDPEKYSLANQYDRTFQSHLPNLEGIRERQKQRHSFLYHANETVNAAAENPIGAQTSNSVVNNKALSREINVNVGDVVVQTQGHDAKAISNDLGRNLVDQIRQAMSDIDDGVAA